MQDFRRGPVVVAVIRFKVNFDSTHSEIACGILGCHCRLRNSAGCVPPYRRRSSADRNRVLLKTLTSNVQPEEFTQCFGCTNTFGKLIHRIGEISHVGMRTKNVLQHRASRSGVADQENRTIDRYVCLLYTSPSPRD